MEQFFIKINKNIYCKYTLLRTCYLYLDNYYIYLDEDEHSWIVQIKSKDNVKPDNTAVEDEFKNRLIYEDYRESLIEKTKNIKEMIVARALYGAEDTSGNIDNALNNDKQDYNQLEEELDRVKDDPYGIAVPWEEKYKNKQQ
ncbi:MAG: His-Xaa-Ser system protein HxsD [Spirochaetes bacterium]|nr:His-Xaa-Ser system protein HxsD [Spirochaetota bacterium]